MKTVLVWILIVHNGAYQPGDHGRTAFSPPMATLEDCKRMQDAVHILSNGATKCVQVRQVAQ